MIKYILSTSVVLATSLSTLLIAQTDVKQHIVQVQINNNAFMCPNLSMKIKRVVVQRKTDITNWQVATDYNNASFTTTNSTICNSDSIIKIFTKEAEYPLGIIQTIRIDGSEVYKRNVPTTVC